MPIFEITAPDGRKARVEGAEPPTDADMPDIFGAPAPHARIQDMEGLFAGVDQMDKYLGADASRVNEAVSGQTDAKAMKMRAANTALLATAYGEDADKISRDYDRFAQDYAQRTFGITESLDDAGFYAKAGSHIKQEKAQDEMLAGMAGQLFEAARSNKPFTQTFEAFKAQASTGEGYVKGRDDYYRKVAKDQWAYFRTNAIRLQEPINRLSSHMAVLKGGLAPEEQEERLKEHDEILAMLGAMPEQDAEMVIDFASGAAAGKSDDAEAGGVEKLARRVEGGLDRVIVGAAGFFQERLFTRPGDVEALRAREKLSRRINSRMAGEVDPLKGSNWLTNGFLDAAESMPRLLVSLNPAGLAVNLSATQQEIKGRFEDQGIATGQADIMASFASVPYTALDYVSSKMVFRGKLPGLDRFLSTPVTSLPGLVGRTAAVGTGQLAEQFGQEVLQDLTAPATQQIAALLTESVPDVDWSSELGSIRDTAPETLAAILPLVLIGTGTAAFKDRGYGREYFQNRTQLEAIGLPEPAIQEVIESPTPEVAGEVIRQNWKDRQTGTEKQKNAIEELNRNALKAREEMGESFTPAQKALIEKYPILNSMPPGHIPIEIKGVDGQVYPGIMNGFYELSDTDIRPSIGRHQGGGWSHGLMREGESIVTVIPTSEQWAQGIRDVSTPEAAPVAEESTTVPQLEQQPQQPAPEAKAEEQAPPIAPRVDKVPDVGYVVTDKNSGSVIGSSETQEGAAQIIQDAKEDNAQQYALNKAHVDPLREKLNLEEFPEPERRGHEQVLVSAKAKKLDESAEALAARLIEKPRTISDEERAGMVLREAQLEQQYDKAMTDALEAYDAGDIHRGDELDGIANDLLSRIDNLQTGSRLSGTEQGRGLAALRIRLNEDFSLAKMTLRRQVANKVGELSSEQKSEIQDLFKRIEDTRAQMEALRAQMVEVEGAAREGMEKGVKTQRMERKGPSPSVLSKRAEEARQRIGERLQNLAAKTGIIKQAVEGDQSAGDFFSAENAADLAIVGADLFARGTKNFTEWSAKMVKDFGEWVTPHLAGIFDASKDIVKLQDMENRATQRIKELERQIANQEVFTKGKDDLTSPELEEKRAKIAELEEVRDNIRDLIQPKPEKEPRQKADPAETELKRRKTLLEKRITELQEKIAEGDTAPKGRKIARPSVQGLEVLEQERDALNVQMNELRKQERAEGKEARAIEKRVKELQTQIEKKKSQIASGDVSAEPNEVNRPQVREIEEALQEREALNEQIAQIRKAQNPPMTDSEKEANRLDKEIARIEKQIEDRAPFSPTKQKKEGAPENEGKRQLLDVLKQRREAIKDELQAKDKEDPMVVRQRARQKRIESSIEELERRLKESDFTPAPKRTPVELNDAIRRLEAREDLLKQEFEAALEKDRYSKLSVAGKAGVQLANIYDSGRNLMTTGELSFLLRQGLLAGVSRPGRALAALPDTFKALLSDREGAHAINLQTLKDPLADQARAAGLFLPKAGTILKKQEEMMMGRWSESFPIVRNFNQAATTYLNRLRLDSWKAMRASHPAPTPAIDKSIARYVNHATGRGTGKILDNNAVLLSRTLFSARYLASRFQYFAGTSLAKADPAARKVIAKEYARTLVGLATYYALIAGAYTLFRTEEEDDTPEITTDPRSSDFGKLRFGEKRIDPLAGLSQAIVFTSRLLSTEKVNRAGEETPFTGRDMAFFAQTKANPILSTLINLSPMLRGDEPRDIFGKDTTAQEEISRLLYPITYADMKQALEDQDVPEGSADALLLFLGLGIQNVDKE